MNGYFSLVLHTHMPYVRKNGSWPVGENWLYQVMSETYLPLLGMLAQLEDEGISPCLGITMTPVLCEQLADPYIRERFISHLEIMAEHTSGDIQDFIYFSDEKREALAEAYLEEYRRKLLAFVRMDGDLLGALAAFEGSGLVETIASAATHAFLPGLEDWRSVRNQVQLGIESHRRHLGVNPAGFWIPECAWREGLEDLLEAEGIRYMLLDPTALRGLPPNYACYAGSSRVAVLARSERAHRNAWDEDTGYPTDGRYLDSVKYYHGSGLHYWKVTAPGVSIEKKEVYEPMPARQRALEDASHFIDEVENELASAPRASDGAEGTPLVLASYDTEFFGHGWKEGIYWLEVTLRSMAGRPGVRMTTPSRYLEENPPSCSTRLQETTWGTGRDDSTWLNGDTAWMWEELDKAQRKFFKLPGPDGEGALRDRALAQAARELLLLESSDWPYMVAKDRASEYAIERFRSHLERYGELAGALECEELEQIESRLCEIEDVDNIFAKLDLETVSGSGTEHDDEGR